MKAKVYLLVFEVLALLLTSFTTKSNSFIIGDSSCFKTCTCLYTNTAWSVQCDRRNLTRFPNFVLHDALPARPNMYTTIIHLENNILAYIPFQAFGNVATTATQRFEINLENNRITEVSIAAFHGLETKELSLDFTKNLLTALPPALSKLNQLVCLNLVSNPIAYFDPFVFYFSAKYLESFSVSLSYFSSWPLAFKTLSPRYWLIDGYNGTTIPSGSFKSRWNPTQVRIVNSRLVDVSSVLCDLHDYLGTLYLENNMLLNADTLSQGCKNRTHFDKLSQLVRLDVVSSGLTHVPIDLKVFPYLQNVRLSSNNITAISDNDFKGVTSLRQLDLAGNPITSISARAFTTNTKLEILKLDGTSLSDVYFPYFLLNENSLRHISGLSIQCSCGTLRTFEQATTPVSDNVKSQIPCVGHGSVSLLTVTKDLLPLCP